MDGKTIGYWVTTGLFSLMLGASGAAYLAGAMTEAVSGHLGYPLHFVYLLGTWKLLGAIALIVPLWPRVKEWAYAGFFFNLTGAAIAHAGVGDGIGEIMAPAVPLGLLLASYLLRPDRLSVTAGS
ncbi:MAG: DoxX family protein [Myxococcales bacterium]|nr:DoxX family protein [Myxococcales bacterium]